MAVGGAILGLDEGEIGVRRQSEQAGEVRDNLPHLLAAGVRHRFFATAKIKKGSDTFRTDARRLLIFHNGDASRKGSAIEFEVAGNLAAGGLPRVVPAPQVLEPLAPLP